MTYYNIYVNKNGSVTGLNTQPIQDYISAYMVALNNIAKHWKTAVVLILEYRIRYSEYVELLLNRIIDSQDFILLEDGVSNNDDCIVINLISNQYHSEITLIIPKSVSTDIIADMRTVQKYYEISDVGIVDVRMGPQTVRFMNNFVHLETLYVLTQVEQLFSIIWR